MVKNDRNDHMFFTTCNDCKYMYAYSKGNGMSSLVNHKCSPKMAIATTASGILHFVKHCAPNSHQKKKMLNALSDMGALDLRPFYTVSSAGFRGVIQQALDICCAPKFLVDPLEGPSMRQCGSGWNLGHDPDF
jgi:hypothetical protein